MAGIPSGNAVSDLFYRSPVSSYRKHQTNRNRKEAECPYLVMYDVYIPRDMLVNINTLLRYNRDMSKQTRRDDVMSLIVENDENIQTIES